MPLSTQKVGFIKTNLMGKFAHLHTNSDPCVQTLFPGVRKLNNVNNDFKLCFHVDMHIYIKYSTLINGDKD